MSLRLCKRQLRVVSVVPSLQAGGPPFVCCPMQPSAPISTGWSAISWWQGAYY